MGQLYLIISGASALVTIFGIVFCIRRKNILALILLFPYIFLSVLGLALNRSAFRYFERKEIQFGEMQYLGQTNNSELIDIIFNSSVKFGDGQCAGGLIHDPYLITDIRKLLESRNIFVKDGQSLIWLKDSKSTKVLIGPEYMFFPDQVQAQEGIWISLVDKDQVKHIKKMDSIGFIKAENNQ